MENQEKTFSLRPSVHKVLAHSYLMHFLLFLIGVSLDITFQLKIYTHPILASMGVLFLILGSVLIFWAQYTSRNLNIANLTKETFSHGPYRFTRTPTNFGIFFLVLGFGIVANAFFIILSSLVSFIVAKFTFLNKQEKILAEKYGVPYLEYKKAVKF